MGQAKQKKLNGTYPVSTAKPVNYDKCSVALPSVYVGYKREHPLIEEKVIPESMIELRNLIALPVNKDIYDFANKQKTIEDCLGAIAASVDIALDGQYEMSALCALLCKAVKAKMAGKSVIDIDPTLAAVKLIEREDTVSLEFAGELPVATEKDLEVAANSKFLQEVGCQICNHIALCRSAAKCLGNSDEVQDEAIDAAQKKEFLDS